MFSIREKSILGVSFALFGNTCLRLLPTQILSCCFSCLNKQLVESCASPACDREQNLWCHAILSLLIQRYHQGRVRNGRFPSLSKEENGKRGVCVCVCVLNQVKTQVDMRCSGFLVPFAQSRSQTLLTRRDLREPLVQGFLCYRDSAELLQGPLKSICPPICGPDKLYRLGVCTVIFQMHVDSIMIKKKALLNSCQATVINRTTTF